LDLLPLEDEPFYLVLLLFIFSFIRFLLTGFEVNLPPTAFDYVFLAVVE